MRRVVTVAVLAAALFAVSLAPAGAKGLGAPEFRERWSFFDELHPDSFVSEICEAEILHEISGKGTFKMYENGMVVDHFNVTTTIINPATGDTVIRQEAGTFRGMGMETFDEDTQTLTIMFKDTVTGLPSKFYQPGEGLLWRDAGRVTFEGTVVLDMTNPDDPVFISEDVAMDIRGPHPELTEDFEVLRSRLCGALGV